MSTDSEGFVVKVRQKRGAVWVAPSGELDLATAATLDDRLATLHEHGCECFVLDLRGVVFLDSTGIALLMKWDTYARQNGIDLELIQGPWQVQRVLQLTGASDRLTFRRPP